MTRFARFSLANRALIALVTLFLAVFGVFSMTQLKQELIPSIELPQVTVVTALPGSGPDVLDERVSGPIADALGELEGVEQVVADSQPNLSLVSAAYEYGMDPDDFTSSVNSAVEALEDSLPEDAEPSVMPGSTDDVPVIYMTASSAQEDSAELSATLEDTVAPRLEDLEGVRAADVAGGVTEQVEISPDQEQLALQGLSPQDLTEALDEYGTSMPLGSVDDDGLTLPVEGGSQLESVDQIRDLPLASQTQPGTVVTMSEVAEVELVEAEQTSITRMNGQAALSVSITATADADIVDVSELVEAASADLTDEVEGLDLTVVFDQAPFIVESIQNLAIEGAFGLLFAVAIILVFLLSLRSTLVTAVAIPLSVLVTFVGLNVGGYSLNMLTLGGLTLSIGRLVDDSIVVIENIKRHVDYGTEKVRAIITGVREVAGAVTSSTMATVVVFIPIAVVGDLVGELFAPFALTVTIALLSSLLVALTVVPVLSYWFLRPRKAAASVDGAEAQSKGRQAAEGHSQRAAAEAKENRSWLQRGYRPVLRVTQKYPVLTVVASAVIFGVTLAMVPFLRVDFIGNPDQDMAMVTQEFDAGTDLESISAGAEDVESALTQIAEVDEVMLIAGTGEGGDGDFSAFLGGGGATATYMVNTDPEADQTALREQIRADLEELDAAGEVTLVDPADMGGFGGSVDVEVRAEDDAALEEATERVLEAVDGTPDTTELTSDLSPEQPTVQIQVDRVEALENGFSEGELLGLVASTLSPQSIGSITSDGEDYQIYLARESEPQTVEELSELELPTEEGLLTLGEVASIEEMLVPTSVQRQDGDLIATISLTPAEGQLGPVTAELEERVADVDLPEGTEAAVGGLAEMQQDSFEQLGLAMIAAVAIVFLLLVLTFRSMVQPLILLVSIPFAATGSLGLLLLTGRPLGVSALIGMLMLIGIVVSNAIVLIDLINQYRQQGQPLKDAIFNGSRHRVRPILMTALSTVGALIPMAVGFTGTSGFISQDLAIVVMGGLVSSTLLTLLLVPAIYLLFERGKERRRLQRGQPAYVDLVQEALAEEESWGHRQRVGSA